MRIISGAQTGVDRGALDAALDLGLECGGTVPQGRLAEDGRVPDRYPVEECDSPDYSVRTELNVRNADATLILVTSKPTGGTKLTLEIALRLRKPCLVVNIIESGAGYKVREFLDQVRPTTLNVAGPRESGSPGIADRVRALLVEVLGEEPK